MKTDFEFKRHALLWNLVLDELSDDDLAHDKRHVLRVYNLAIKIGKTQGVDLDLCGAAAIVHDLVNIPKESKERSLACGFSADASMKPLSKSGYEEDELKTIFEAVKTCSWSSGLSPVNDIGAVLQDADRLDAIGAIGTARTLTTAQAMVSRGSLTKLYDINDPLAKEGRELNDKRFALDHFLIKLTKLERGMHTLAAKQEASRRHAFMMEFLEEFVRELG